MRKVLFFVPLICLLYQAADARAGYLQWSATWTETPVVAANGGALSGGITFSTPGTATLSESRTIPLATLSTFTSATSANPDQFNSVPYGIRIVLTDLSDPYHDSDTIIFTGAISGSLSTSSANLSNKFTSPTTQIAVFSRPNSYYAEYLISVTSFIPPTSGSTPSPGSITLQVTAISGPAPVIATTPEPASLALAGLGMTAFGLGRWRRLRAPAPVF